MNLFDPARMRYFISFLAALILTAPLSGTAQTADGVLGRRI
jgi:hypothetical protein